MPNEFHKRLELKKRIGAASATMDARPLPVKRTRQYDRDYWESKLPTVLQIFGKLDEPPVVKLENWHSPDRDGFWDITYRATDSEGNKYKIVVHGMYRNPTNDPVPAIIDIYLDDELVVTWPKWPI